MLLLGLTLAEALLEAELPEPVRDSIHADPKVRQLAGQMQADFFHVGQRRRCFERLSTSSCHSASASATNYFSAGGM